MNNQVLQMQLNSNHYQVSENLKSTLHYSQIQFPAIV